MSESNSRLDVLFVNGINTAFGGSVAESNKIWGDSFRSNKVKYEVFDTVPRLWACQKNKWYLLLLSIYFLPGTFFRILRAPVFEFAYKISPVLLIRFIVKIFFGRFKRVVFSHHSIFFLALFCSRVKRIFLIQDLMYVRGRSRGASRKVQRFYLFVEMKIYRLAPTLLVQSYHEWRVLRHFLDKPIYLIGCCKLDLDILPVEHRPTIAVISDWRRPENVHGVMKFFSSHNVKTYDGFKVEFRLYGFNSEAMTKKLQQLGPLLGGIKVENGGVYDRLQDISEGYFLVPIYHGAGIKRKTLEALCAGRMVIGTKGAFIGLPSWMISKVILRVESLDDLKSMPCLPDRHEFSRTLNDLSRKFKSIGELKELWH